MSSIAVRAVCALFAVVSPLSAQHLLESNPGRVIHASPTTVWFEKQGTVWLSDGTKTGTRDTGVPVGGYGPFDQYLRVYHVTSTTKVLPDGTSSTTLLPGPYDGFDADSPEPLIWRRVFPFDPVTGAPEVIDVSDGGPWVRKSSSSIGRNGSRPIARLVTPYAVLM